MMNVSRVGFLKGATLPKNLSVALAAIVGALVATAAMADIYKTTDSNGVVLFTDVTEKVDGKQAQKLPERYVSSIPAMRGMGAQQQVQGGQSYATPNYRVQLTSPQNDSMVHRGNGSINISASVTPTLQVGDYVELYVDGKKVGDALSTSVDLAAINRGMHVASATVFSKSGKQVASAKASFYLYQQSRLLNNNGDKKSP